jgi:chromate reductase
MSELLIISGTNRNEAISPSVANTYLKMATEVGFSVEIIDLRELPADYINTALYENSGKNSDFNPIRIKMKAAKKYLFVVPEYNGSFPGVLKAFIDGLDFPDTFRGKKAAVVGVSAGVMGGALALSHLSDILNYCGTSVLARKPRFTKISANIANGLVVNESYLDQIQKQVRELKEF